MSIRAWRVLTNLLALLSLATVAACSNISAEKVTSETRTTVATRVVGSSLSAEDKAAFAAANVRAENGDYDVTDKTVSQIIVDERAFDAQKASEEAQAARLVAEARAKKVARDRELRSALSVGLVSKGFHEADYMNQEYQSKILITFVLKNLTKKGIRSIKGMTHFENSVGDDIRAVSFVYEDGLGPNETATYDGTLDFNQFDQSAVRLREADLRNVHLRWEPQVIIFQDGSRLTSDAGGS